MVGKRTRTAMLIAILLIIVISAIMLFIRYPSKFEIIYGGIGAIMAAIALYLSMHSLDVAESAQKDSSRSADATEESTEIARQAREDSKLSAEVARDALHLALEEQAFARERYRSDRGPQLNIHKQEMLIPFISPFARQQAKDLENMASQWDYSTIFLSNDGAGAATTIDMSWDIINAHDFDGFQFYTKEFRTSPRKQVFHSLKSEHSPAYGMDLKLKQDHLVYNNDKSLRFSVMQGEKNQERSGNKEDFVRITRAKSGSLRRIGMLKNGVVSSFDLPWAFRVLAQQFFLERIMVPSEDTQLKYGVTEEIESWKTPNPRLRVRFQYIDAVLEHMNDFKEAIRVKEFEITCSDVVNLVQIPEVGSPSHYPIFAMRCNFNLQMIYDRSISEINAEKLSIEEEEADGSTRPTEG